MATRLRIDGETRGAVNETEALKRALGAVGDVGDRLKRDLRDALSVDSRKGVTEARQMERAVDQVGDQAEKMRRGLRDAFRDVDSRHAVREAKQLDRAVDDVSKGGGRLAGVLGGAVKVGLFGLVAGLAAVGLGAKAAFSELGEAEKVSARTASVLESTGGIAGVTAGQVDHLSESLMRKSGVDDEVVKSGENVLLTFTNIRNVVGEGNDVFNQATKATLDLSVATGRDMPAAATLMGKALNDPIKGLSALSRIGVQFTAGQKEQITALVESGRVLDAQKLILAEVEKRYGGAAEAAGKTFPGQLNVLRNTALNVGADLVSALVPALNEIVELGAEIVPRLADVGERAADAIGRGLGRLDGALPLLREWGGRAARAVGDGLAEITELAGTTIGRVADVLSSHEGTLRSIGDRLGRAFGGAWDGAMEVIRPFFERVLPAAIDITIRSLDKLTGAADEVAMAVGGWDDAFQLIVGGLIALKVGQLALAMRTSLLTSIREVQAGALAAGGGMTTMGAMGAVAINGIRAALISTGIGALLVGLGLAATYVITHWDQVKGWFLSFGNWLRDHWKTVLLWVAAPIPMLVKTIISHFDDLKGFFAKAADWIKEPFARAWAWLREQAAKVFLKIVEPFSHLPGKLGGWARDAKDAANRELAKIRVPGSVSGDGGAHGRKWATAFVKEAGSVFSSTTTLAPGYTGGPTGLPTKPGGKPDTAPAAGSPAGAGKPEVNLTGTAVSAPPKQHVMDFVKKVAAIYGGPLTITSGTRHNASTGRGKRSDHADGNAADIDTPNNQMNAAVGWAAIRAAGGDPSGASGGYYNIGNVQVIFGVSDADGNHFNHVHVGVRGQVRADDDTTTTVAPDGTKKTTADTGTKKPAPISPAQKSLQEAIGKVVETARGVVKDIPEVERLLLSALERLYEKLGDKALSAKALAGLRATGADLRHALQNLIRGDELRDRIQNLRATIGTIADDQVRGRLSGQANQLAALWKRLVKDGLTDQELSTFRKRVDAFNTAVSNAFRKDVVDQVERQRGRLNDLFKQGFISEDAYEKASAALDRIPKMIQRALADDGIIGPKERQAIRAQLAEATKIVGEGADQAADAAKKFGRVGDLFRELFTDRFLSDAELGKLRDRAAEVGGKLGEGLQAAVDAVSSTRERFRQAWSDLRSTIETAFREKVVGKFQLTIDFATRTLEGKRVEDELKDAEREWARLTKAALEGVNDEVRDAVDELVDAWGNYYGAIERQDTEGIQAAADRIVKGEDELARLRSAGLDEQAQAILTGGERLLGAMQAVGQRTVDQAKTDWEQLKTEALGRVMAYVDEVGGQLERGEINWSDAMRRIAGKLQEEGMAAGDAMELLSGRTDSAMAQAASALSVAVAAMTAAIGALVAAMRGGVSDFEQFVLDLMRVNNVTQEQARQIAEAFRTAAAAAGGVIDLGNVAPGTGAEANAQLAALGVPGYQTGTAFVDGPAGIDQIAARLTRGEMVLAVEHVRRLGGWLRNLIRGFGGWRALPLGLRDQMRGMFPAGALPRLLGGGMDALPPRGRPVDLAHGPLPMPRFPLRLPVEQMAVGGVAGDQTPLRGPMSNSWLVSPDAVRVRRSALPGAAAQPLTVIHRTVHLHNVVEVKPHYLIGGADQLARELGPKLRDELELHRLRNGWLFGGDT